MSTTSKASQRIAALLDDNSFVEIGGLVTARATDFNLKPNETPSDGCITGYGVINGNLVYVYSQDASVLNGTIGEMHAKKITNLYDLAMKTGAPVIGLIESAGLRLQEATDALAAFGDLFKTESGKRRDSTDNSDLWNLRRGYGGISRHHRLHFHGREECQAVRKCS